MHLKIKSLDEWLSSRSVLFAFSIVLSFALWFYVVGNRNEEIAKTYEVRLEFLNPPAELALFPSVRAAIITLSGERRAINALSSSSLTGSVDLRNLTEGRHSLPVNFRPPSRTTVAQIVPRDIEVELARMVDKDLKVKVLPPEDMPVGYIMDGAAATPEMVKAHGRADQLSSIYEIEVRPSVEDLFAGGSWRLPLRSPSGVDLEFSPADVTVSATYYQGMPRKDLPVEVRTRGTLPTNLRLISAKVVPETLTVEGRSEAFAQVEKLYTEPINLARLSKSMIVQTKLAELPAGLSLLSGPVVSVNIELKTLNETRDFVEVPIVVRGNAQNEVWQLEPSTVTVRVEGSANAVNSMTLEDLNLSAYVDVSNVYSQSLRLLVREAHREIAGIESVTIEPLTVKVMRQTP